MLTATDVVFRAGSRALVDSVSATFEPGRLHLVIGPNGAGKSTLIKLLARMLTPSAGRVSYDGVDARRLDVRALARRRAVLSQAVEVAFPVSSRELVMMGRYPHFTGRPAPADEAICDEVMRFFDVVGLSAQSYATLSGGEKQRVNFARVLAQVWRPLPGGACRYLFLDEPLTFLDIRHQIEFMQKVRSFADQTDVVTVGVVHDLALAARFADRLLLINRGRVAAAGSAADVLTAAHLQDAFAVSPVIARDESGGTHLVFA
jgi:iron complex transport system ATP-binding protein